MKRDISKINKPLMHVVSISEALSNSDGKTSGSKLAGAVIIAVGCATFIVSCVGLMISINESSVFAGIAAGVIATGATLFGYSKKQSNINQ